MTTPSPTVVKEKKSQIRAECDIVERRTGKRIVLFFFCDTCREIEKKERKKELIQKLTSIFYQRYS
jgi:hypothetical protein